MKDWKLEKGILSSKWEETRNCKVTVRIGDAVQGLPKKEEDGNYERQADVYGTLCAVATTRGYSEWIQSTSVDKMVTNK